LEDIEKLAGWTYFKKKKGSFQPRPSLASLFAHAYFSRGRGLIVKDAER